MASGCLWVAVYVYSVGGSGYDKGCERGPIVMSIAS